MTSPRPLQGTPRRTRLAWLWATFFGAGYLRPGPGTYGSAAATLLWYAAFHFNAILTNSFHRAFETLAAALLVTLTGIAASTRVARESGCKDPGFVVIDEVAGQLFALVLAHPDWRQGLLALALFRILDITKPWPIRRLEALPEGLGIMLDDVAAGLLALVAFTIIHSAIPGWR